MKNKSILFLAFIVLALFASSSCKKDTDSNDLTTDIVGKYTNGNLTITVNKVDNTTVSIAIEDNYGSQTHASTKMNTNTSFTLNQITETYYKSKYEYSGSGTYSSNNIIIVVNSKEFDATTGVFYSESNTTYTASK